MYYDILPRYLRGMRRLSGIGEETLVGAITRVFRLAIHRISHGDAVPRYPDLHLEAMQRTSRIADQLQDFLRDDPWVQKLGELLGRQPSLAYAVKQTAHEDIFGQLLALFACYYGLAEKTGMTIAWNPSWPEEWYAPIKAEMADLPVAFFAWPRWYCRLYSLLAKIWTILAVAGQTLVMVLDRGVGRRREPQDYQVITEFIDPTRLNRSAYDADYWLDGDRLKPQDILFFLTRSQRRQLQRDGYALAELKNLFRTKGYHLAVLDELPYSWPLLGKLASLYLRALASLFRGSPAGAAIFSAGWAEFLDFSPLFEHYRAKDCIYLTFPNGHTGFRLNDAVVTGLCRGYGIRSVGCQTRTIYTTKYEDCFDCFDLYLGWGPAWHEAFPRRRQFIKEIATVGCIYLDTLLPQILPVDTPGADGSAKNGLMVSIFPSDMSPKHHYTAGYAKRFLRGCLKLAARHPEVHFLVKLKDRKYLPELLQDQEFSTYYHEVKDNFEFVEAERYDYSQVMRLSDIVIAIGFTTPGSEGLLLGKRAMYYSELSCGGQAFRHLPGLVAADEQGLQSLFEQALKDYPQYGTDCTDQIALLDPFRDGQARRRILDLLEL